mgnify:CR=1 FL=1
MRCHDETAVATLSRVVPFAHPLCCGLCTVLDTASPAAVSSCISSIWAITTRSNKDACEVGLDDLLISGLIVYHTLKVRIRLWRGRVWQAKPNQPLECPSLCEVDICCCTAAGVRGVDTSMRCLTCVVLFLLFCCGACFFLCSPTCGVVSLSDLRHLRTRNVHKAQGSVEAAGRERR